MVDAGKTLEKAAIERFLDGGLNISAIVYQVRLSPGDASCISVCDTGSLQNGSYRCKMARTRCRLGVVAWMKRRFSLWQVSFNISEFQHD